MPDKRHMLDRVFNLMKQPQLAHDQIICLVKYINITYAMQPK